MITRFDIGDTTIHRIVEMEHSIGPALEFLPNLTPELLDENRAWLQPAALSARDEIILCFQSHIIQTPHHTILVDTCIGNDKTRPNRAIWNHKTDSVWMDGLAAAGMTVEDVDFVVCTHLHADHVGWNTRLDNGNWVPTFPNARYLFSETELAFWTGRNAVEEIPCIVDGVLPIVAANRADLITSSHVVNDLVRLLPTPGHTIDHFAIEIGRGKADAVITGDLIHSPLQARYPHLQMRLDYDPVQAAATRREFLETICDTDTLCCFAHFPSPSTGHVKRWGDGFRCDPVR